MSVITRPAACVFDLDGTIANTFDLMVDSFASALEGALGRRLTRPEVVQQFGPGAGTEPQIIQHFLGGRDDEEIRERYYAWYVAHADQMPLFPGIREALDLCRDHHVPVGLMTGKGRRGAELTLAHNGILDRFAVIITGDEATRPKPDPMGILLALEALKVAPADAIYIGDSRADIMAGKNAGVHTVLVGWNNPTDAAEVFDQYHPDAIFYDGDTFVGWLQEVLLGESAAISAP